VVVAEQAVKKVIIGICALGLMWPLAGCRSDESGNPAAFSTAVPAPPPAPAAGRDRVLATINGDSITLGQLEPALMQAYGLGILLDFVQRDLAQQQAAALGLVVTPQDIANERALTLLMLKREAHGLRELDTPSTQPANDDLTPAEASQLLEQMLNQAHLTRTEFDLIIEINAYLRKIVAPEVQKSITDEAVRQHFNGLYGERMLIHFIVVKNMNDVDLVRRDLAAGKSFEDVARARSLDQRTAASGGEWPPFTLQDNSVPDLIKQTAFYLKKGDVSDPLQYKGMIYIIKLVDRIPPAHAKYEDYRDAVRQDLYEQMVQAAMAIKRKQLWDMAQSMEVKDPELNRQWQAALARRNGSIQDMQDIRREMDQQHEEPATQPTTAPGE
jgi:foldase protein PrsA